MAAPTIFEQWMLEMLNMARLDPAGMAAGFGISLNDGLPPGTISSAPKQVLAMSDILLATSRYHNEWMIANNSFSTVGDQGSDPGQRMAYAGFNDGEPFLWGEALHWDDYASGASINQDTVAYRLWREMFLDPESRAILLDGDFNEIGIGFTNGVLGGAPSIRIFSVGHDLGRTDQRFITGGVFQSAMWETLTTPPTGMADVAISGADGSSFSNTTGGYRIAATSSHQTVNLGSVTVGLEMPDENVKLDLVGGNTVRSSHTITLLGGAQIAELLGVGNADLLAGSGMGSVYFYGNKGSNRLVGSWADDHLDGGSGADRLVGGFGDDWYVVDNVGDVIEEVAGQGADTVLVQPSNNVTSMSYTLASGVSVETMRTEGIISLLQLVGNEFGQAILGNFFAENTLIGGGGNDSLHGSYSHDTLHGGTGRDLLYGGGGGDRFVYLSAAESAPGTDRDVIGDWEAGDLFDLSQFDGNLLAAGQQGLTFVGLGAATRTVGPGQIKYYHTNGNTYLVASVDGDDQADFQVEITGRHHFDNGSFIGLATVIPGTPGDDTIAGTTGDDVISGGLGRDTLTGSGGADRFVFGAYGDSVVGERRDFITDWSSNDKIDLSSFDARRDVAGDQKFVFVGAGAATRDVGAGQIKYYHVNGKTYLVGNSDGDGAGDFQIELNGLHHLSAASFIGLAAPGLTGTPGADTLNGTAGNDVLRGGLGADVLYGGGGSDKFVYVAAADSGVGTARDVIKDWSGDDRIDLSLLDGNVATPMREALTFVGYGSADRTIGGGAIKYYQTGGNTYVVASVNGDNQADFQIEISGLHTLTASNFLL